MSISTVRLVVVLGTLTIAGTAMLAAADPPADTQSLRVALVGARQSAVTHFAQIQTSTGLASQIVARLDADLSALSQAGRYDPGAAQRLAMVAQLDADLVSQLVNGNHAAGRSSSGASMHVFKAGDGTQQPVAIYAPASLEGQKGLPLVVFLHAQDQTESELVSQPVLRQLADESGAIIAAPWARGDQEMELGAAEDVYGALRLATSLYSVDQRRIYLAGFSYGAFTAFAVAPLHPANWRSVLSISGSLTNDDKDRFARSMWGKQAYLVIGSDDPLVKAQYVSGAAAFLNANGVECHYYEQRGGVHSLESLQPSIERAWRDMLSGVRNVAPENQIPSPAVTTSQRY